MPEVLPTTARGACPICGRPAQVATRPFCSDRCKDIDLNRWLSGTYVIPGRPEDDEDEHPAGDEGGDRR
jgi:endogenous inhibitor of DNA gyrase (YacG/DUF329 family)